ncbi:hypothetical protein [Pseudonocardia sp. N23]|uniref:hypothetical protein n=1 Tax=Pseudonocardia sp. N23 TaxID=1987376 RepID=UPI000BFD8342|nr:hypothetical protein [Pseudonocardia sp. N23]GAY07511.1 hypothetical protein TOK_3531 [Pseudonocardia sp. N23]
MPPLDRPAQHDRPRRPSPHPDSRTARRLRIADDLLDRLEALVDRHRDPTAHEPGLYTALYAELVTAEVAHELAMARSALRRTPHVPPTRHRAPVTDHA